MKSFFLLIVAVLPLTAEAQPSPADSAPMGLGMVRPDFYNQQVLYFYGNPNLEKSVVEHMPSDSLVFERTELGTEISYAPPWFVPAHLKLDYEILYLRCLSIQGDFLEVVVNEQTERRAYVERYSTQLTFWPMFLLSMSSVEPLDREANPVRIKALSHASQNTTPYAFLKPLGISAEWMRVELMSDDFQPLGKGWIRWRANGQLSVRYSLLS